MWSSCAFGLSGSWFSPEFTHWSYEPISHSACADAITGNARATVAAAIPAVEAVMSVFISSFLWSTGCVVGTSLGASAQWHNGSHHASAQRHNGRMPRLCAGPAVAQDGRDVTAGHSRGLGVSASRSTRSTPDRRRPDHARPVGCSAAGSSRDPPVRPVASRMRRRTHRSRRAPRPNFHTCCRCLKRLYKIFAPYMLVPSMKSLRT